MACLEPSTTWVTLPARFWQGCSLRPGVTRRCFKAWPSLQWWLPSSSTCSQLPVAGCRREPRVMTEADRTNARFPVSVLSDLSTTDVDLRHRIDFLSVLQRQQAV